MAEVDKKELIENIYKWVAKDAEVPVEKEKVLRVMIEATLDYLYERGYLDVKKEGKGNGTK